MPRKLGQHFLVSPPILEKLAKAACGSHTDRVIEIGPGRGALTGYLLPLTDDLHVVELDESLAALVQRRFGFENKLHVHRADVLETDLAQWGSAVITGNLPYYITSPIIQQFLNLDREFAIAVFLVQREVAERLLANPGNRDFGYLTVATQLVCSVELVCPVPSGAFAPPPKVESAAVRLVRRDAKYGDLPGLLAFVSRCFRHKRKTLRNNLRAWYGLAVDALPEANLRAEQLTLEQFIDLHQRLYASTRSNDVIEL